MHRRGHKVAETTRVALRHRTGNFVTQRINARALLWPIALPAHRLFAYLEKQRQKAFSSLSRASEKLEFSHSPLAERREHPDGSDARGVTHNILGWGCAARSWKPLPYFRPKYTIFHTLFQTWLSKCIPYFRQNVYPISDDWTMDLRRTGLRDAPNDVRGFFSSRSMSTATHVTLKIYPRPNRRNIHPISDQNGKFYTLFQTRNAWMVPFGAAHTYMASIWEYPSPPPPPPLPAPLPRVSFDSLQFPPRAALKTKRRACGQATHCASIKSIDWEYYRECPT